MCAPVKYDKAYYQANKQSGDRIALQFYYRLAASFVQSGKVLDYGCGMGHFIKRFKEGYEPWAYDVSTDALESVKDIAPYVNICLSPDSLEENTFDLIVSLHVLEHMANPLETLLMFQRLLSNRGILIYVVPNASGMGHRIKKQQWIGYGDPSHVSLYDAKTWLSWTDNAGFRIMRSGTDGLWDVPYLKLIPLWIQKLLFYPMPAIQVMTGRLLLPADWGESLIVVAQKN
jgi:2-polyprenyl-3-methyl-5-hydroxy-6-metoxy-1,4-benzoquinol methylase